MKPQLKKKWQALSLVLMVSMVFTLIPFGSLAEDTPNGGGVLANEQPATPLGEPGEDTVPGGQLSEYQKQLNDLQSAYDYLKDSDSDLEWTVDEGSDNPNNLDSLKSYLDELQKAVTEHDALSKQITEKENELAELDSDVAAAQAEYDKYREPSLDDVNNLLGGSEYQALVAAQANLTLLFGEMTGLEALVENQEGLVSAAQDALDLAQSAYDFAYNNLSPYIRDTAIGKSALAYVLGELNKAKEDLKNVDQLFANYEAQLEIKTAEYNTANDTYTTTTLPAFNTNKETARIAYEGEDGTGGALGEKNNASTELENLKLEAEGLVTQLESDFAVARKVTTAAEVVAKTLKTSIIGSMSINLAFDSNDSTGKDFSKTFEFKISQEDFPADVSLGSVTWGYRIGSEDTRKITASIEGDESEVGKATLTLTPNQVLENPINLTITAEATASDEDYNIIIGNSPLTVAVDVSETLVFTTPTAVSNIDIGKNEEGTYRDYYIVANGTGEIATPITSGGKEPIKYSFKEDSVPGIQAFNTLSEDTVPTLPRDSRITINETTGVITVGKDTNRGTYYLTVTAKDATNQTASQEITLTVTNAYDDEYYAWLDDLAEIEKQIDGLLKILPPEVLGEGLYNTLSAFRDVSGPLGDIWNEGDPTLDAESLAGLISSLTAVADTDDPIVQALVAPALSMLTAFTGLSSGDMTKAELIDGLQVSTPPIIITLPIFGEITIPGLSGSVSIGTYVDVIKEAATAFEEFNDLLALQDAYTDLQDFVLETDYTKLNDLGTINDYIQGLNSKYAAVDEKLRAFADLNGPLKGVAEFLLTDTQGVIKAAIDSLWTDQAQTLISGELAGLIGDPQIAGPVGELLDGGLGELKTLIDQGLDIISSASLEDILNYSSEIRKALGTVAGLSKIITDTVDDAEAWVDREAYEGYLKALLQGDIASIEDALQSRLDGLRADLEAALDINPQLADMIAGQIEGLQEEITNISNEIREIKKQIEEALNSAGQEIPLLLEIYAGIQSFYETEVKTLIDKLDTDTFLRGLRLAADEELSGLEAQLEDLAREALGKAARASIESLLDEIEKLRGQIAENGDINAIIVAAQDIWTKANEIFSTALSDYGTARPFVEEAVSFAGYLAGIDLQSLDSLEAVRDFTNDLAARYSELHADFANLENLSDGAKGIIDWALAFTDEALLAALPMLENIAQGQLGHISVDTGNEQLDSLLGKLLRDSAGEAFGALRYSLEGKADETLEGLIARSARIGEALNLIGTATQYALDAVNWTTGTIDNIIDAINRLQDKLDGIVASLDLQGRAEYLIGRYNELKTLALQYAGEEGDKLVQEIQEAIDNLDAIDWSGLSEKAKAEISGQLDKAGEALLAFWGEVVDSAEITWDNAYAFIDGAVRAIPNPHVLIAGYSDGTVASARDHVDFTTNYNKLFRALAKLANGQGSVPQYSAVDLPGISWPEGFTLSGSGRLTVDRDQFKWDSEKDEAGATTRTVQVTIEASTGIHEIDALLKCLGVEAIDTFDITLKLQEVTLTYYSNDEDELTTETEPGIAGTEITTIAPDGWIKDGYELSWDTEADGTGDPYAVGDPYELQLGKHSNKLYAQWTAQEQTLTYHRNDGGDPEDEVTEGGVTDSETDVIGLPEGWGVDGYTFIGWSTERASSTVDYAEGSSYTFQADTNELYAVWEADSQTLTYYSNDGRDLEEETTGKTDEERPTIALPDGWARAGYTFTGWAEESNGRVKYAAGDEEAAYIFKPGTNELYAVWEADGQTLTYHRNDGGDPEDEVTEDGKTDSETAVIGIPEGWDVAGYTFKGWSTERGGTTVDYAEGSSYTFQADTNELYAVWEADSQTLTYYSNDGRDLEEEATGKTDEEILTIALPDSWARAGYDFTGWAEGPNGPVKYAAGDEEATYIFKPGEGSNKLYAIWAANAATVNFYNNYNTSDDTVYEAGNTANAEKRVGEKLTKPAGPTRDGYAFDGWHTDRAGTEEWGFEEDVVPTTGTVSLYAKWTEIEEVLVYYDSEGNELFRVAVGSAHPVTLPGAGARLGYDFAGWSRTPGGPAEFYADVPYPFSALGGSALYAVWAARDDTPYTANHWLVGLDGFVTLANGITFTGTTGATVDAVVRSYEGYTYAPAYTGSILSGTIAGDGSLVLSVFYTADEPEPPIIPDEPPVPPVQAPQPQAQIQPQAQTTPAPESEEAIAGPLTPATSGTQPGGGTSSINDIDTPMSSGDAQGWSLLNLLLTLLIAALMAVLLGTYLRDRKDEGRSNTRHIAFTAVGIAATAVAAIVFFITSDLSMPMQVMDSNTARFALIAVMQAALAVLARRKAPATE